VTYEYRCCACGHTWEAEQRITEEPHRDCPQCGKPEAQRLVSGGTGFSLKGAGWARDKYGPT
jgi:putative FmdB family regulatory protein